MRVAEEPLETFFVLMCPTCGEHLEPQMAEDRADVRLTSPSGLQHMHFTPDGEEVWIHTQVVQVVRRNEAIRLQGERDVALATVKTRDGECSRAWSTTGRWKRAWQESVDAANSWRSRFLWLAWVGIPVATVIGGFIP